MPKGKCLDCRIVYQWPDGKFPTVANATCPVHGTKLRRTTTSLQGFDLIAANPVTQSETCREIVRTVQTNRVSRAFLNAHSHRHA